MTELEKAARDLEDRQGEVATFARTVADNAWVDTDGNFKVLMEDMNDLKEALVQWAKASDKFLATIKNS